MTPFIQYIQKLPSTNIITLNLKNNLVQGREKNEKLEEIQRQIK